MPKSTINSVVPPDRNMEGSTRLRAADADLGEIVSPWYSRLTALPVTVRVAVCLIILVAATPDAEAVECGLDAGKNEVSVRYYVSQPTVRTVR